VVGENLARLNERERLSTPEKGVGTDTDLVSASAGGKKVGPGRGEVPTENRRKYANFVEKKRKLPKIHYGNGLSFKILGGE